MGKKIAIVSFTDPCYGSMDGGKKNIERTCIVLSGKGYDIDFYAFHNKDEQKNNIFLGEKTKEVVSYCTTGNPLLFLGKYPFCVERRWNRDFLKVKWSDYDAVLFEGEQVYKIFKKCRSKIRKCIIRMHDIESVYRDQIAQSQTGIFKKLNLIESQKFSRIENELWKTDVFLGFVSCDELKIAEKLSKTPINRLFYLPPFFDYHAPQKTAEHTGDYILYFGDMSLTNNLASVNWYLEKVYLCAKKICPALSIHLCGKIPEDAKKEFEKIDGSIVVCGYVESLEKEIQNSRFIVCPILYGAGVKIKLLEALSYGKLVIANRKALEGTYFEDKKHLFVAKDTTDYIKLTADYYQMNNYPDSIGNNLKSIFDMYYSSAVFLDTFGKMIAG